MAKLKELFSIVSSLNEDEVKTLQRYLHCFDTVNENHEPKGERLLNLIIHNNQAELKLFEKKFTKQAFSMLVMRLYDKVLDTLTFDVNIKRPESYNDLGATRLMVRKRILYTQALGSKNQISEAISLYQKNIVTAKEFEFYDELLTCMYELQNIYAVLCKHSEFEALDKEIQHFEEVRQQVKKAFNVYTKYTLERNLTPENDTIVDELELALPKLKTFYLLSQSAQAGWFYYRLLIEYHQAKQNYAEGYTACTNLLKLQQENPTVRSNNYMAIAYKLMARFSMFLYNFDDALLSILKTQNFDKTSERNIELNKETEFLANFYRGSYVDAQYTVNELVGKIDPEENSFSHSKYCYYSACCSFLDGSSYAEISKKLAETKEIEKDKEGWNIAVRILSIMHQIDNEDFDLADSRIESMRKHIERTMKDKDIRPRFIIILKTLRDLVNNAFDFQKIWATRQNYFTLLADETDETHRWRILSPELIRFDVWFEAKATRKTYQEVNRSRFENKRVENMVKAM